MSTLKDIPLPKHVSDSMYAAIIEIYKDMFELIPKSNLVTYLITKQQASPTNNPSGHNQQRNSKFLSFGSFNKKTAAISRPETIPEMQSHAELHSDVIKELANSKEFKRSRMAGTKNDVRASWHGETNNSRQKNFDTHL